jgi:YidC/Oxa1 family membrane protein insertase
MIKAFFKTILYKPFFNLLAFFAYLVPGHSLGWAIIALTLLVRALLWVPSMKAMKAPLQMRQYQEEIKALQERHKADRMAQSQALMAFYKEKGINPLSGCLPLLIQLPIIIILYRVFIAGLHDVRPDLLYSFTPHLNTLNTHFFGIDLSHPNRVVMPILAAGMQFLQSRHLAKLNPTTSAASANDPSAMMTKQMTYLFPIMTFVIALSLPAGLALYWASTSLFTLIQQYFVAETFKPTKKATVTVREKAK